MHGRGQKEFSFFRIYNRPSSECKNVTLKCKIMNQRTWRLSGALNHFQLKIKSDGNWTRGVLLSSRIGPRIEFNVIFRILNQRRVTSVLLCSKIENLFHAGRNERNIE